MLSLDHTSQEWAERARDRHVAEEHTEPAPPELAAHHRTLAAVARVHADAIRSLHHRSSSQLDDHTARLLHVLDDELARVLTQLAETADALQPESSSGYDGPSVQEAAADDRRYWDVERDGE